MLQLAHQVNGVECGEYGDTGTFTVRGPGMIAGEKGVAVFGRTMNVFVRDLTIQRCDVGVSTEGKLLATNVLLAPDRESGLSSGGDDPGNVVIDGYGYAVALQDVFVRNVVLGGAGSWPPATCAAARAARR